MGGVGKVLTFAYMVGGWVKDYAYVSKILEVELLIFYERPFSS